MDPELQGAHHARVPYLDPQSLGLPEGRHIRVPSRTPLHESYETQQHVTLQGDRRILWRTGALLPPPLPTDVTPILFWLLSAWNPHGAPTTLADNLARNVALGETIAEAGGEVSDIVTTVPPDRSWAEDTLIFRGIAPDDAVELAVRFGQPVLQAMGFDMLTIIPTGLSDDVHLVTLDCDQVTLPMTCPMRSDDIPGARCAARGGPWVSASMVALAIWAEHRGLLLEGLGCTPCANGTQPTLGPWSMASGSFSVARHYIASRYGGHSWGLRFPAKSRHPTVAGAWCAC